ncbi:MAG: hypothetical protein ACREXS_17255 [Gammaproteobacteria bacterium]
MIASLRREVAAANGRKTENDYDKTSLGIHVIGDLKNAYGLSHGA